MERTTIQRLQQHGEHALSLLVVLLMLMAAALWTGRLFGHAAGSGNDGGGATASQASAVTPPDAERLQKLGIDGAGIKLEQRDSASWNVTAADGTADGVIVSSAPYAGDVKGFAGPTPLYVYINAAGKVSAVAAADNSDTPDFFNKAFDALSAQWNGHGLADAASLKVDAVSGATFSSKAIIANVQQTLAARSAQSANGTTAPAIGWGRTLAVALVLLTGVIIRWRLCGNKWLRIVQLVLNVGVLGFWCGQFLSLSLLRGWVANGLDFMAYLPTLLVLGVAMVMPFFRRKHHYCSWVCPYGSLQELAGRLPLPKIHCSATTYRVMARIRFGAFCLLMLLLWCGVGAKVLDYEPFTAFMLTNAAPEVIALAGAFLVASCFVPNLWCKCFCQMGSMLDLSEDDLVKRDARPATRK